MYFAELNNENVVTRIIVAESQDWCEEYLGGTWVQADEPLSIGNGYSYDSKKKIFLAPPREEVFYPELKD